MSGWRSDVCASDLFGFSLDAFEAQLRRMSGLEDGITDGLYRMSRPITGGYYWCPPLLDGRLALRALARRTQDRQSVVQGKSVSVRVALGGRRLIKKRTTNQDNLKTAVKETK